MIKLGTLLTIIILGPGAAAIFIWFLVDVSRILFPRVRPRHGRRRARAKRPPKSRLTSD